MRKISNYVHILTFKVAPCFCSVVPLNLSLDDSLLNFLIAICVVEVHIRASFADFVASVITAVSNVDVEVL